ncbi:glycosyltransferase family 4 protein [Modicisalibacter tunisiensis]|uniref:glycosyltransferase family 4 protein n=1 Tax=Modicisalibacter tunisiensis TaxID=390637 RepID=UPI001CCCF62C|nr:glycosyltransferase family 4 protein [Modicisalibacter tunisiensis]MBZ9539955.1 glycosyltransferase family 4 protein [Modicisalibacter tunisiensis]
MKGLWSLRTDLQHAFDIQSPSGQRAFIRWYFIQGVVELGLTSLLTTAQLNWLLSAATGMPRTPNILALIWNSDRQLQQRYPDPGAESLRQWTRNQGEEQYPILRELRQLVSGNIQSTHANTMNRNAPGSLPFGLNLIGYARGQFGIGEDVRMAAKACLAANIPFSIYNVEPGREVSQNDSSVEAHVSDHLPYTINLFCTTGIETARLAAVEGHKLFEHRYNIGYWPWELPEWPRQWRHAYDLVDEVWASSRFAYQAFQGSSPKPVRHMPMAVTTSETADKSRADFGLPSKDFLFVFSFDFLSSLARKNPQACVAAFQQAFPQGDEPVGLVVKAMRATDDNPLWQQLQQKAARDQRIHIINETLSRGEVLDLYRACDCFISLHRSEGFGRGIAEAMQLGKPVITTGHSGNMDFTTPGTAALVDHHQTPLGEKDYPFGSGQYWAEPHVESAAWWMQQLQRNSEMSRQLATQGRQLVDATYSPVAVGRYYREILASLPPSLFTTSDH